MEKNLVERPEGVENFAWRVSKNAGNLTEMGIWK